LTLPFSLRTCETVVGETLASRATSLIVAGINLWARFSERLVVG
jgi:hypothetical protein